MRFGRTSPTTTDTFDAEPSCDEQRRRAVANGEQLGRLDACEAFAESTADDVIVVEGLRMRYGTTEAVSG